MGVVLLSFLWEISCIQILEIEENKSMVFNFIPINKVYSVTARTNFQRITIFTVMHKIGIAEDDDRIIKLLKTALVENGYAVVPSGNGTEAFNIFLKEKFDLFIIDIMIPGMNGLELCARIRNSGCVTPILMLTAMGTVDEKVTGLEAGADDYMVKPFHLKELLARVSVLMRRNMVAQRPGSEKLCFEDLCLDMYNREVVRSGKTIELSAKESLLLELFLRNPNRLLTREYIAEKAWDISFETGTNVIDVYINFLRKKIDRNFDRKLIHTRINMGYILK